MGGRLSRLWGGRAERGRGRGGSFEEEGEVDDEKKIRGEGVVVKYIRMKETGSLTVTLISCFPSHLRDFFEQSSGPLRSSWSYRTAPKVGSTEANVYRTL